MKKLAVTFLLLSLAATQANAECNDRMNLDECDLATTYTGITTFAPTIATQMTTEGAYSHHHKLILAAQEDAQVFVASGGAVYGVQLASAVEVLRADIPELANANEMQIARAILGQ